MNRPDTHFGAAIASLYQAHMVPMLFEPYATELVARVLARPCARVLEVAAGTGVVTRHLAEHLPAHVAITATDLNPAMLDLAQSLGTARPVVWQVADAMQLPFGDAAFDAVVCQFGAMFFPDKVKGFAEAHRVLAPGGALFFNVWDRLGKNEFADTVTTAMASAFPLDPPRFLARVPHGYHDLVAIARDLAQGGFTAPHMHTVQSRSHAASPRIPAEAMCQGTPLRAEIEARDIGGLEAATAMAEAALAYRFGTGPIEGRMQAHVITAVR